MAISAATVLNAYDFQRLRTQTHTISADEYEVWTCKVDCEWITTAYATANDATITPATMIQGKKDGATVTVIGCCFVAPGRYSLSATPTTYVLAGAGIPSTITSSVITLPLTAEDLSTEMTDTTALNTATWQTPMTFQVTFYQKVIGE